MIVLAESKIEIRTLINNAINCFTCHNPSVKVYTLGLYSCPWAGWLTLNFDTQHHSTKYVDNLRASNISWFGQDHFGTFCNNCSDFEYVNYAHINLSVWQRQYESQDIITVKNELDQISDIDLSTDGDEAFNKVFFEYYIGILEELEKERLFDKLNQEQIFRLGVQMLDSSLEEFWIYQKR